MWRWTRYPGGRARDPVADARQWSAITELSGALAKGTPGSLQLFEKLTGNEQLWWRCCRDAATSQPYWLLSDDHDQALRVISDGELVASRGAVSRAAEAADLVSRALAEPASPARPANGLSEVVGRAADCWDGSPAVLMAGGESFSPEKAADSAAPHLREQVTRVLACLDSLTTDARQAMVAICALLLAAGQPDAGRVVGVPVVFGRPGERPVSKGVAGTLELREFPSGPAGLFPDPRGMRNRRADAAFDAGLGLAWQFAAGASRRGRCVLWHLSLDGGVPDYAIDGGSLGAAFAVALRELLRRPRGSRPGLLGVARAFFVRLRPKCAITGALAVQQPSAYDQVTPRTADGPWLDLVGDMDAKLDAAQAKGLRLVAPTANRASAQPRADVHVDWAETIYQADRYARRVRPVRTAVSAIAILAVAGTSVGVGAAVQARSAEGAADAQAAQQHTAALSGTLAADALANISTNLDIAELLAAEAYHLDPDPQTRAALFAAVTADPHLVRYLPATASVTALASSADGHTAVEGTADGEVLRWDLTDFQRSVVARLPAAIASVAVSQDGTTIAAADSTSALVWVKGKDTRQIPVSPGQEITAVAVSPAGQYAAFSLSGPPPYVYARQYVVLDDVWTGKSVTAQIHWPIGSLPAPVSSLGFNGETQLIMLGNLASWERLAIPSLTTVSASGILAGADDRAQTMSATGNFISWTDGGSPLQVWTTSHAPSGAPSLGAGEVGVNPNALAISADGQDAAEADDGTIYVSGITSYENASSSTVLPLTGNTVINELTFAGSGHSELLSASGALVTLWNLDQYSRITRSVTADIPTSCVACPGPDIYPSPDGNQAIISGNGSAVLISLPWSGRSAQATLQDQANSTYGPALWAPDGQEFSILTPFDGGGEFWSAATQLKYTGSWPSEPSLAYSGGTNIPEALLWAPGDTSIIEIETAGNFIFRNPKTGSVERQVAGPKIPYTPALGSWSQVAADASAKYAAVMVSAENSSSSGVDVVNIGTGAITPLPGGPASGVAYDGELLVVQRTSGSLEVWSDGGRHLIRSFAGDVNATAGPVVSPAGLAVEVGSNGSAEVYDVSPGQQVGSIVLPVSGFRSGTSVAFTPDGQDLISATEGSGQVTEWSFSPSFWSTVACTSAGHSLTSQEWQQYVGGALGLPARMACTGSLAPATAPSPGAVQASTSPMTSASASPSTSPSASRCLTRQERCG